MVLLRHRLKRFGRGLQQDNRGATDVEYGLFVALLSVACITAMMSLGIQLATLFTDITSFS